MNTILYMKDIAEKHPYIDYNTKNQSFLRIALVLKRMGIHNYYFFLSLYDRTLLGVDPRSPNLTTEQMLRISQECKINIWYFLREVVRVPVIGQEDGTPFELNRGNLALTWAFMNDVDIGLVQPRQTGKTIGMQCIIDHAMYVAFSTLISACSLRTLPWFRITLLVLKLFAMACLSG